MLAVASHAVEGYISRGFEAVREAFAENSTFWPHRRLLLRAGSMTNA